MVLKRIWSWFQRKILRRKTVQANVYPGRLISAGTDGYVVKAKEGDDSQVIGYAVEDSEPHPDGYHTVLVNMGNITSGSHTLVEARCKEPIRNKEV